MNEVALQNNTPNIIIERGKRAYQKIKVDAVTMRENWRMVGEALLVGRRMYPSNQAFGKWCKDEGFDMDASTRSNAMWVAENFSVSQQLQNKESHPTGIRQAYNEALRSGPIPLELREVTSKPTIELDTRSAEKVVKLVKRSKGNDEGSAIAKKHVGILAEKHGVSAKELERAAARKAPELYHGLTPIQINHIKQVEEAIGQTCIEMVEDGFTKESVKDIFYKFVDAL